MSKDLPKLPDNLPDSLGRPLRRMREELQRLTGFLGDDPALTLRNAAGLGSGSTTIIVGGGGTGGGGGDEPDPTPPPTVSDLAAAAGITQVIVTWSGITYTQGHGNKQTLIYAVKKAVTDVTMPTFPGDAGLVGAAPQALTILALPSEPNTRWHIWAKFETNDGVKSTDPAGGVNGVIVTTAQDPTLLLEALTNSITRTQLFDDLGEQIDLITDPDTVPGSVNARIKAEETQRISGDSAQASRTTALAASIGTAGGAVTADPLVQAFAEHWEVRAGGTAPTIVAGSRDGSNAMQSQAGIAVQVFSKKAAACRQGETYKLGGNLRRAPGATSRSYLVVDLRDAAGAIIAGDGTYWYYPAALVDPGTGWTRYEALFGAGTARPLPSNAVSMHVGVLLNSDPGGAGGVSWVEDLGLYAANADRVQGNLSAYITTNDAAVADLEASKAEASSVTTLSAQVNHATTGLPATRALLLTDYRTTAATDSAIASATSTIQAQLDNPTTGLPAAHAAVATEASARVALDGSVQALYTVRVQASGNGSTLVGGIGLAATSTAAGGPTINFGVRADQFFIAPPGGQNVPSTIPFIVRTTTTTEGGLTVDPGVYMNAAYIVNLTVLYARIANLIADQITTASLSAAQLTAGDGTIGGNLKSSNYVAGTSGWLLSPSGTAFFMNAVIGNSTVTATIYAGAGTIGGFTINASDLRSSNYVPGSTGMRINASGSVEFYSGTFRGDILATSIQAGVSISAPTITGGTITSTTLNSSTVNSPTVVAGLLRNTGNTNRIDLNATGAQNALSFGSGKARITADGEAYFLSNIDTGTWNGSEIFCTTDGSGVITFNGKTFYIDTGVDLPYQQFTERSLTARISSSASTFSGGGGTAAGNYIYVPRIAVTPCVGSPHFRTGAAVNQATNPYGSGNQRIFLKVDVDMATTNGNSFGNVSLTSLSWSLDFAG